MNSSKCTLFQIVGKVIGKKGVVVLHIQRESATRVIMSPPANAESAWSPVLIIGDPSRTLTAFNMVKELVDGKYFSSYNITFYFHM